LGAGCVQSANRSHTALCFKADVEAVEKSLFNRKIIPEWRDPNRAIRHFID